MTARAEAEAIVGPALAGATAKYSQSELAQLCRLLAREGLRDHEIAEYTALEVTDVRRWLGNSEPE